MSTGYPTKNGYENNQQSNLVARAIVIHPNLANLWKQIGYHEICIHYNSLVMNGTLLILFPPKKPIDWVSPDLNAIVDKLKILINIGFELTKFVMKEAARMFFGTNIYNMHEVMLILKSFNVIRSDPSMDITIESCFDSPTAIAAFNERKNKESSNNNNNKGNRRRRKKIP